MGGYAGRIVRRATASNATSTSRCTSCALRATSWVSLARWCSRALACPCGNTGEAHVGTLGRHSRAKSWSQIVHSCTADRPRSADLPVSAAGIRAHPSGKRKCSLVSGVVSTSARHPPRAASETPAQWQAHSPRVAIMMGAVPPARGGGPAGPRASARCRGDRGAAVTPTCQWPGASVCSCCAPGHLPVSVCVWLVRGSSGHEAAAAAAPLL
jgi:hypothetical protein